MLSTKFLMMRAVKMVEDGNALAAAYYCEIAAIHHGNFGNQAQAKACKKAAEACHLMSAA